MMLRFTVALLVLAQVAASNPIDIFQYGGRSQGMAGATASNATDLSAGYYNPALLARFRTLRVDFGGQMGAPSLKINGRDVNVAQQRGALLALVTPGNIGGFPLAIGITNYIPLEHLNRTLALDTQTPRFSYYNNRPQRALMSLNFAAQLTDKLSIGGGLTYMSKTTGQIQLDGLVGFPSPETSQLSLAMNVDLSPARYGQVGVFYQATEWLGLAAAFRTGFEVNSQQEFIITADIGLPNSTPFVEDAYFSLDSLSKDLFQPAQLVLSGSVQVTPTFLVGLDVGLHQWSAFSNPAAELVVEADLGEFNDQVNFGDPPELPLPNFQDTIVPRVGVEWTFVKNKRWRWDLRGGYAYEPSPAPKQIGETNFLILDKHTLSTGIGLSLPRFGAFLFPTDFAFSFAATFLEADDVIKFSPVDPSGDFKTSGYSIQGSLLSTWRF